VDIARRERRALPPAPGSVRDGRHFVGDVLTRWGLEDQLDTATLLASEVASNAVIHAVTPFVMDVSVDLERQEPMVAVTDFDARPMLSQIEALGLRSLLVEPDLEAESGRGLMMVASLSDRWGIEPAPRGKTVWFSLSLDSGCD
jgi:anti-sigma regulatory factor (Ser/Thr protein kinase)